MDVVRNHNEPLGFLKPRWFDEWTRGPWRETPAGIRWLTDRSVRVKRMMVRFPPGSVVRARKGYALRCPTEDQYAIVTDYLAPCERYPRGSVSVRPAPRASICYAVGLDEIELVGFYKGMTTERLLEIFRRECPDDFPERKVH